MSFNAHDRCDSCTAAAQVRVRKVPDTLESLQTPGPIAALELDFCGHHAHKYADSLDAQGFFVVARKEEPQPA